MTAPSTRDQWLNRPRGLRHLSFAEWLTGDSGVVGGTPKAPAAPSMARTGRNRHSTGEMNGLEKRYALHLELRRQTGEIQAWKFEALKLKLAPATFYTPDFLLLMADGKTELHETKGSFIEDDAAVKIKVARVMFNGIFDIVVVKWDKRLKSWTFQ